MVKLKETKKQLMKLPLQTCGHETRITETWGRLKLGPRNLCRDCARFMHCSTISVYFLHEFEASLERWNNNLPLNAGYVQ